MSACELVALLGLTVLAGLRRRALRALRRHSVAPCPGPLIWYNVGVNGDGLGAVLECNACGYLCVTTGSLDKAHEDAPTVQERLTW